MLVTNSRFLLAAELGIVWPQALLEEENKELRQARRTVRMSVSVRSQSRETASTQLLDAFWI